MDRAGRLRKGNEMDRLFAEGIAVSGPLLVLRHAPNGLDRPRWGFAVGKKLSKKAVVRNRVRRRLREAARGAVVCDGVDIVVTARKGSVEAPYRALRESLEATLRRAGLSGTG